MASCIYPLRFRGLVAAEAQSRRPNWGPLSPFVPAAQSPGPGTPRGGPRKGRAAHRICPAGWLLAGVARGDWGEERGGVRQNKAFLLFPSLRDVRTEGVRGQGKSYIEEHF